MPYKKSVTMKDVVSLLNDCVKRDRECMDKLVNTRVVCNKKLANHNTVQIKRSKNKKGIIYEVGLLGILNGLFGVDETGWGAISANSVLLKNGKEKVEGFVILKENTFGNVIKLYTNYPKPFKKSLL
jgi:hypothetical protein